MKMDRSSLKVAPQFRRWTTGVSCEVSQGFGSPSVVATPFALLMSATSSGVSPQGLKHLRTGSCRLARSTAAHEGVRSLAFFRFRPEGSVGLGVQPDFICLAFFYRNAMDGA